MVQRKRPRQACCCQNAKTVETTTQQQQSPSVQQQQPQRKSRQRHSTCNSRHGRFSTSWKMTMTTFLLWLCDNGLNHNDNLSRTLVNAWGSSSSGNDNSTAVYTTKKGLQIVGSCSKEDFLVKAVYLLCDSPGAYYRGSSTYRDSTTCTYGDKARLQLEFAITDSFTGASSIRLEIESGIYDQWKRVAILDDLCSYDGSNLQRIYNEYESMTSCPTPGLYQLDTYFTVPAFTKDSELHYTPDVRFRFFNAKGKILGCATTGTLAMSQKAREHATQGLVALMTAFFALICLFTTLFYLNYGRERRILADKQKQKLGERGQGSDMMRPRPVTTNSQSISAADQEQRYHYFNGADEQGLNGSSDMSNTSNACSSRSSHHHSRTPQKPIQTL